MLWPMTRVTSIDAAAVRPLLDGMRADDLDVIADEGTWLGVPGDDGRPAGVARLFERDGHWVVDDVWVAPAARRRGIATALLAAAVAAAPGPVWLICDLPDIAFYAKRGFVLTSPDAFPDALARHYAAKNEWPASPDHEHMAMRAD